eukprot:TRINITY_DN2661_c0_g1_i2.p1 TRINITY_DN2661_c0_g1~~TRINITY_DN2661_c0_g1_i2.p1  ORF type:complete len:1067 (-),score=243.48 TRINITY_DN2661_c0_g1_i2:239-3280(-)
MTNADSVAGKFHAAVGAGACGLAGANVQDDEAVASRTSSIQSKTSEAEKKSPFLRWLQHLGLERYEEALTAFGYDSLQSLAALTLRPTAEPEAEALAIDCEMPHAHVRQFRRGLWQLRVACKAGGGEALLTDASLLISMQEASAIPSFPIGPEAGTSFEAVPLLQEDTEDEEEDEKAREEVAQHRREESPQPPMLPLGLARSGGAGGAEVDASRASNEAASPPPATPAEGATLWNVSAYSSCSSAAAEDDYRAGVRSLEGSLYSEDDLDESAPTSPRSAPDVHQRTRPRRKLSAAFESAGKWLGSMLRQTSAVGPLEEMSPDRRLWESLVTASDDVSSHSAKVADKRLPAVSSELLAEARKLSSSLDYSKMEVGAAAVDRNSYSVLSGIDADRRAAFLKLANKDTYCKRAMGCLMGMAVGDAVGAAFEFVPISQQGARFDPKSLEYTGALNKFELKRGQWSDDTSMGLCIADSLLCRRSYDGSDIRVRFWNWWFRGYNNAFRFDGERQQSVGLGGNIRQSLLDVQSDQPSARYEPMAEAREDAGNGSLMRLAPLPLYFHGDLRLVMRVCAESSFTTHPGQAAADACAFLGYLLALALTRPAPPRHKRGTKFVRGAAAGFLEVAVTSYMERPEVEHQPLLRRLLHSDEPVDSPERCWNWRDPQGPFLLETFANRGGSYNGHATSEDYMGSYCMDALAIALHCFYHTSSFMGAITKCVNLLGDADTTAAICGQLAGCFYGISDIDSRLVKQVKTWDGQGDIAFKGALVYVLGRQLSPELKEKARMRCSQAMAYALPEQPPATPREEGGPAVPASAYVRALSPTTAPRTPKTPKTPGEARATPKAASRKPPSTTSSPRGRSRQRDPAAAVVNSKHHFSRESSAEGSSTEAAPAAFTAVQLQPVGDKGDLQGLQVVTAPNMIKLTNTSADVIAFRFFITAQGSYLVTPGSGVLVRGEHKAVKFMRSVPWTGGEDDRLLLQKVVVKDASTKFEAAQWAALPKREVEELQLLIKQQQQP